MKQIKFSDFTVIPISKSASRAKISDEIYFSPRFSGFISNSKMKGINPEEGGSMQKYYGPSEHLDTSALSLGRL